MTREEHSIFDKDFLPGTVTRRRDLLSIPLKIYIWCFLVLGPAALIAGIVMGGYDYLHNLLSLDVEKADWMELLRYLADVLFGILPFLANLFILMEKRWAVLLALVVTGCAMLLSSYTIYNVYALTGNGAFLATSVGWLLLRVPYLVMLWRIKNQWEMPVAAKPL